LPWTDPLPPKVDRRKHASVSVRAATYAALRFENQRFDTYTLCRPRRRKAGVASSHHDDLCCSHAACKTCVI